jgi:hypothetical protein
MTLNIPVWNAKTASKRRQNGTAATITSKPSQLPGLIMWATESLTIQYLILEELEASEPGAAAEPQQRKRKKHRCNVRLLSACCVAMNAHPVDLHSPCCSLHFAI